MFYLCERQIYSYMSQGLRCYIDFNWTMGTHLLRNIIEVCSLLFFALTMPVLILCSFAAWNIWTNLGWQAYLLRVCEIRTSSHENIEPKIVHADSWYWPRGANRRWARIYHVSHACIVYIIIYIHILYIYPYIKCVPTIFSYIKLNKTMYHR